MSELLEIGQGAYQAPEGLDDLADRDIYGKRLFLYVGDKALLDVVELSATDDGEPQPTKLLLRLEADRAQSMDLFIHPANFATPEDALRVFEKNRAVSEAEAA